MRRVPLHWSPSCHRASHACPVLRCILLVAVIQACASVSACAAPRALQRCGHVHPSLHALRITIRPRHAMTDARSLPRRRLRRIAGEIADGGERTDDMGRERLRPVIYPLRSRAGGRGKVLNVSQRMRRAQTCPLLSRAGGPLQCPPGDRRAGGSETCPRQGIGVWAGLRPAHARG